MSDQPPSESTPSSSPSEEEEEAARVAQQVAGNKRGAFMALGLFMVIPLVLVVATGSCGSTEGSLRIEGGPHGSFTLTPTDCHSMQPYGRMGANLHGAGHNDGAIYPTVDPLEGVRLDIEVPGSCRNSNGTDCTVFRVPRDHCSRFEVSVEHTNTTVNDVRLVRGHTRVDCTLEDETHVVGEVVFDGC